MVSSSKPTTSAAAHPASAGSNVLLCVTACPEPQAQPIAIVVHLPGAVTDSLLLLRCCFSPVQSEGLLGQHRPR